MYAHPTRQPIPQPPHSAGQAIKGFRTAIDYAQIPSPVDAPEHDRARWERQYFTTLPGQRVPLSTTDFLAIDQGNASPKFLRTTTWNVPSSGRLARECAIPIAGLIQPFAELDPYEEPVPLVGDTVEHGPARCEQCRGYINPWCLWVAGGSRWKCNLCGNETEVASNYFSNLDGSGLRLDHLQRPELNKGVVDFAVPDAYWAPNPASSLSPSFFSVEAPIVGGNREPKPMNLVFLIESTLEGVNSGFLRAACNALLGILYGVAPTENEIGVQPCILPAMSIAIMTFDGNVNFYDLSPHLNQPRMVVVADLDEVFVPLREGLFVDPQESRTQIEALLQSLHTPVLASTQNCVGSALRGALAALAGRGGHVVLFSSTLPNVGPDASVSRVDEASYYDTDKEKNLLNPSSKRWADLGEECAEHGVGVSAFVAPNAYVDLASIASVVNATGGELFFHPRFDVAREDTRVLASQLRRLIGRPTAYNCLLRVRCSNGLRINKHYGAFSLRSDTGDLALGVVHADSTFAVELTHGGRLDARENAHIQCALLYTTVGGQRRVRIINLAMTIADLAGNVFKYADMDATVAYFAKDAMSRLLTTKLALVKEELTDKCASILLGYRKNCAIATPASQLILPDVFQALPAYTLGILKTKPLKGRTVASDVRSYYAHRLLTASTRRIMELTYPCLLALHDLDDTIALPDPNSGVIDMPACMRSSHLFMEAGGVYVIENGEMTIFWVGLGASPQTLQDLFGVDDVMMLSPHLTQLPLLDTRLSTQVRNVLTDRVARRGGRETRIMLARQNTDGTEIEFADLLVEDQNNGAMSYVDYLCQIHKQIHTVLTEGGSIGGSSGLRGTPW